MDPSTAQLLRPDRLARRHLDQRWPAQEHLRLVLHEDGVVGQRGVVRAAGGRRAEDDGAGRLAVLRPESQVAEELAAFVEDAELLGEEDAGLVAVH